MSKPRELWILFNAYGSTEDFVYNSIEDLDIGEVKEDETVHVIEYSAYEGLLDEYKNVSKFTTDYEHQRDELKAKLAIAVEALGKIAHSRCAWQLSQSISHEALAAFEKFKKEIEE